MSFVKLQSSSTRKSSTCPNSFKNLSRALFYHNARLISYVLPVKFQNIFLQQSIQLRESEVGLSAIYEAKCQFSREDITSLEYCQLFAQPKVFNP